MSSHWGRFLAELRSAGKRLPYHGPKHPREYPLAKSDHYGSSLNFEVELRLYHRDLIVPSREATFRLCQGCRDGVTPTGFARDRDWLLVCPSCWGTTRDRELDAQRALAGEPRPEPPTPNPGDAARRKRLPRPRRVGVIRMRRAGWHVAVGETASGFVAWASRVPTVADDPENEPSPIVCEYGDSRRDAVTRLDRALSRDGE